MTFSATEGAFEGFRLTGRHPLGVLCWAGVMLAANLLVGLAIGGIAGPQWAEFEQLAATASPDTAQMSALLPKVLPAALISMLVQMVAASVVNASVLRAPCCAQRAGSPSASAGTNAEVIGLAAGLLRRQLHRHPDPRRRHGPARPAERRRPRRPVGADQPGGDGGCSSGSSRRTDDHRRAPSALPRLVEGHQGMVAGRCWAREALGASLALVVVLLAHIIFVAIAGIAVISTGEGLRTTSPPCSAPTSATAGEPRPAAAG